MTVTRGTSNSNVRGNAEDRRRRREWLVETYRADHDLATWRHVHLGDERSFGFPADKELPEDAGFIRWSRQIACRCYRCGRLLTVETVTVDRIIPGCYGGTYRRNNIRPACGACNSETGATLRSKR